MTISLIYLKNRLLRFGIALFLACLLVGCIPISSPQGYWSKPGATPKEITIANRLCADGASERSAAYTYDADFFYSTPVDQVVYQLCMRRLGHSLIRSSDEYVEINHKTNGENKKENLQAQRLGVTQDMLQSSKKFDISHAVPGYSFLGGKKHVGHTHKKAIGNFPVAPNGPPTGGHRFPSFYRYWFIYKAKHIRLEEVLPPSTTLGIVDIKTVKNKSMTAKASESSLKALSFQKESKLNDLLKGLRKQHKLLTTVKWDSPQRVTLQNKLDKGFADYLETEDRIDQEIVEKREKFAATLLRQTAEAAKIIAARHNVDVVIKNLEEDLPLNAFFPASIITLLKQEPRDLTMEVLIELDKNHQE